MTTLTKYTTAAAAGIEVHARASMHAAETKCDYRDAVRIVLKADPELAQAYAMPAVRMAATPAMPVPAAVPLAQAKTPGETVHLRTVALMDLVTHLDYQSAVNQVFSRRSGLESRLREELSHD